MPILSMKEFIEYKKNDLKKQIKKLDKKPKLAIITDGKDARCKTYMKSKLKIAEELGINARIEIIKDKYDMVDKTFTILENEETTICQLPIKQDIKDQYDEYLCELTDVDGMSSDSLKNMFYNNIDICPATPKGIIQFLEYKKIDLTSKNIVIVGRGELVGLPLSTILLNKKCGSLSIISSKTTTETKNIMLKNADIVVCASGVKGSVKTSELSSEKEVIVINVGTMFDEHGKLTTELLIDDDKENIFYTDRIGAVGVCTVLGLMENVINFYKNKEN